jgi:carbonic anhydrase
LPAPYSHSGAAFAACLRPPQGRKDGKGNRWTIMTKSAFPERLLSGYESFRNNRLPEERARYRVLADAGQRPQIMIVGCSDSRAAPETIFDADPGEMFVIRNVGNLIPPYDPDSHHHGTSAAIEFAVSFLHIRHIVIMGHGRCGGISAFLDGRESHGDFIDRWISLLAPAAARLADGIKGKDRQQALEFASIRQGIDNLLTFPLIASLAEIGEIELHGAWFDISTAELFVLDPARATFEKIG